jgi:RNA polymerase sigma-70 factor (ECF subfamily)
MGDAHGLGPLLDRARRGDPGAWQTLLQRLRPWVRALCRRQIRQNADASDLAQEVQWRMDRGLRRFRGESVPQFLAWVRQIIANVLIDYARGEGRALVPLPPDLVASGEHSTGSNPGSAEDMARLSAALDRLPRHYRAVFEARVFEKLSCVEIARRLGRPPVWARVTFKRAVERLREGLGVEP